MSKFIVGKGQTPLAQIITNAVQAGLQPLIDDIDAIQQRQKANGQHPRGGLTLKQNLAAKEFEVSANDVLSPLGGDAA